MSKRNNPDGISRTIFFVVVSTFEKQEPCFKKPLYDYLMSKLKDQIEYLIVSRETQPLIVRNLFEDFFVTPKRNIWFQRHGMFDKKEDNAIQYISKFDCDLLYYNVSTSRFHPNYQITIWARHTPSFKPTDVRVLHFLSFRGMNLNTIEMIHKNVREEMRNVVPHRKIVNNFDGWMKSVITWYNRFLSKPADCKRKKQLYVWGESKIGKSRFFDYLFADFDKNKQVYRPTRSFSSTQANWQWEGFNESLHNLVIIDEFTYKAYDLDTMKIALEQRTFKAPRHHHEANEIQINCPIVILSNEDPEEMMERWAYVPGFLERLHVIKAEKVQSVDLRDDNPYPKVEYIDEAIKLIFDDRESSISISDSDDDVSDEESCIIINKEDLVFKPTKIKREPLELFECENKKMKTSTAYNSPISSHLISNPSSPIRKLPPGSVSTKTALREIVETPPPSVGSIEQETRDVIEHVLYNVSQSLTQQGSISSSRVESLVSTTQRERTNAPIDHDNLNDSINTTCLLDNTNLNISADLSKYSEDKVKKMKNVIECIKFYKETLISNYKEIAEEVLKEAKDEYELGNVLRRAAEELCLDTLGSTDLTEFFEDI